MTSDFARLPSVNECVALPEIRVVVLGDAGVGKTALLRQYINHESPSPLEGAESTLLDSYTHVEYCGMQPYRIIFTDCSSSPSFREHRAAYLSRCDAVILVYSVQQRNTLQNLRYWMEEVMTVRGSAPAGANSEVGDFNEISLVVVGTHFGEGKDSEAKQQTSLEEAESLTRECFYSAGYFTEDKATGVEGTRCVCAPRAKKEQHLHSTRKGTKTERSSRPFYGFFHRLFRSSVNGEGSEAVFNKRSPHDLAAREDHSAPCTVNVEQTLSPEKSTTTWKHINPDIKNKELSSSSVTLAQSPPPGASAHWPLFQISNTNGEAVDMAVHASFSLHLWLRQHKGVHVALSSAPSTHTSSSSSSSSNAVGSKVADAASDTAAATTSSISGSLPVLPAVLQASGISVSFLSHDSGSFSRAPLPPMPFLYGVASTMSPTFRHCRDVSDAGQARDTPSRPQHEAPPLRCSNMTQPSSCCSIASSPLHTGSGSGYSTQWSSSKAPQSGVALLASSPKLRVISASSGSVHPGRRVPQSASVNFLHTLSSEEKILDAMHGKTCGDAFSGVEVLSPSPSAGATRGAAAAGAFSTAFGSAVHDGQSLLATVPNAQPFSSRKAAVGEVCITSLPPLSRVRVEADSVEKVVCTDTDSLDVRQTRSRCLAKSFSMECEAKSGLSSSSSQRNVEDSCAASMAVRTSSLEMLTSPVYTANGYSGVPLTTHSPLGGNNASAPKKISAVPVTSEKAKSKASNASSQRLPAKVQATMSSSLLLSPTSVACEETSSRFESPLLSRDIRVQSGDVYCSGPLGTPVSLLNTSAPRQKLRPTHCSTRGCSIM